MKKIDKYNKIELLSPAGNVQSLIMAVSSGADAVYLGLPDYSARKNVDNFDLTSLAYYIKYCHLNKVRVYVAINTLIKDNELPQLLATAEQVYRMGADAFIIQDVFLGKYLKQRLPNISYHLSTQAGVCNVWGASFAKQCGYDRVILARETPIEDIEQIAKIIDTEVFIHGALCTSFSGACLLSSVAGGNSGNRGLCKQPCRKMYSLCGAGPNYAISPKDLCLAQYLDRLASSGVRSLKIEGRARSVEYVGASTSYYHSLLCGNDQDNLWQQLQRTFNRGFSQGLGLGTNANFLTLTHSGHKGVVIGQVRQVVKDTLIVDIMPSEHTCRKQKTINNFDCKDGFKVLRRDTEVGTAIYMGNRDGQELFRFNGQVIMGDKIAITKDSQILNRLPTPTRHRVDIDIDFSVGNRARVIARCRQHAVTIEGDTLEGADNQPLNPEQIKECFDKVEDYPYIPYINIVNLDRVFYGKKQLNQLRRKTYSMLLDSYANNGDRHCDDIDTQLPTSINHCAGDNNLVSIIVIGNNFDFNNRYDIAVYLPHDYSDIRAINQFCAQTQGKQRYLYLPPLFNNADHRAISEVLTYFDGVYTDGFYGIEYSKLTNKQLILGSSCNIFNSIDTYYLNQLGVQYVLSAELSRKQVTALHNSNNSGYCLGSLAVMHYSYCPYGNKCKQGVCSDKGTLTDQDNRTFDLIRYKIGNKCRFMLFNYVPTVIAVDCSYVLNTVTLSAEQINAILDYYNDEQLLKSAIPSRTKCHYDKGVN
ncbi:MAG: U32 family peptidase [Clostridia bacterium]|nr:U32 family peptidase [Clostridia bacterium]